MVGHELRNPLAPMLTALELMRLQAGDHYPREREVLERQIRHMVRLVDDLLDTSRILAGRFDIRRRPIRISAILAEAVEMTSPLLEEQEIRLTVDPLPDVYVEADEQRLLQVFGNLVANAARHCDPGARVTIGGEVEDARVRVWISDDGPGIEPELIARIFEPFEQGNRSVDRARGGLGLGLAITRSLVELHGGQVTAESGPAGRGSRFVVELPVLVDPHEQASGSGVESAGSPVHRLRILVVDDNQDAAELLMLGLEASGHEVEAAHDGPSALEIAARFLPQVAILDLGLPVMDGFELAERLRAQPFPTPRIIALTGYGRDTDCERTRAAGFERHLVKPIQLDDLLRAVSA
jgi:CheY-like chemotaxis protein